MKAITTPTALEKKLSVLEGSFDLVAMGGLPMDFIATHRAASLAEVREFTSHFGGGEPYVAANVVRMGGRSLVIGAVGNDAEGAEIVKQLGEAGINTDGVQRHPAARTTKVYLSLTPTGDPDIRAEREADFQIAYSERERSLLHRGKVFHAGLLDLQAEPARSSITAAVRDMAAMGKVVCFDPMYRKSIWLNRDEALEAAREVFRHADITKPSEGDAQELFGSGLDASDYIERYHALGAKVVILTLGSEGAILSNGTAVAHIPAVRVNAVSAIGAGDAFWAAVIVSLSRGKDLVESAKIASVAGAIAVRSREGVGAIPKFPRLESLAERLIK